MNTVPSEVIFILWFGATLFTHGVLVSILYFVVRICRAVEQRK